jgi:hypothetical protein
MSRPSRNKGTFMQSAINPSFDSVRRVCECLRIGMTVVRLPGHLCPACQSGATQDEVREMDKASNNPWNSNDY